MVVDPAAHLGLIGVATRKLRAKFPDCQPGDWDDVNGELAVELIRAAAGYDSTRGCRFGTYAVSCLYLRGIAAVTAALSRRSIRRRGNGRRIVLFSEIGHRMFEGDHESLAKPHDGFAAVDEVDARGAAGADLADYLRHLDPRRREVLERRFGLGGRPRQTLLQVGTDLGLTRERVRQLESQAIDRLRSVAGAA